MSKIADNQTIDIKLHHTGKQLLTSQTISDYLECVPQPQQQQVDLNRLQVIPNKPTNVNQSSLPKNNFEKIKFKKSLKIHRLVLLYSKSILTQK